MGFYDAKLHFFCDMQNKNYTFYDVKLYMITLFTY